MHPTTHNLSRADQIRLAFQRLYALDRDISLITDDQLKPLRQDKAEIKDELVKALKIPVKLLNSRYMAYRAEQNAIEEGGDNARVIFRELYEALPPGGIVDLVAVAERVSA